MNESATRSIDESLLIDASPEAVWEAFTSAEQIVNWFALRSDSAPGVGGYIGLSWDLKDQEPGRCQITHWKEHEYLRMTWRDDPGGEHELPVELWLKPQDGGTALRLVHSGFLSDTSWDDEYDAHQRGWQYELRSLKYYLEQRAGLPRRHVLQLFEMDASFADAYAAIVGGSRGFRSQPETAAIGDPIALTLPDGRTTSGEIIYLHAGKDFVVTADVLDGGMFRISLDRYNGKIRLWVWAFSWTLPEDEIRPLIEPAFRAIKSNESLAARRI